jgi:hypothetical protein
MTGLRFGLHFGHWARKVSPSRVGGAESWDRCNCPVFPRFLVISVFLLGLALVLLCQYRGCPHSEVR